MKPLRPPPAEKSVQLYNELTELSAIAGMTPIQLAQDRGIDVALVQQLQANAVKQQSDTYDQKSDTEKELLNMNTGGFSMSKADAAQKGIEEKYFGGSEKLDSEGNPLVDEEGRPVPSKKPNNRFLITSDESQIDEPDGLVKLQRILSAIEAQPELDEAKEAKKQIVESPEFASYITSRGYEGASTDQALREYNRELNAGLKNRNKNFRKKRRENLESGLARGGLRDRLADGPKVSDGAKVAGGSDVG